MAARRQAVACAQQADTWGGRRRRRPPPFFLTLVDEYDASRHRRRRARATASRQLATRATEAYASLGRFLVEEYAPHADRARPGRTRALLAVRAATSTASSSTSTRPTRGDGTSCTASSTRWARSPSASCPGADVDDGDRAPRDRPDARDRGRRRVPARGTRSCSTPPSPSSTARTSTSPSPVQRVEAMIAPPGGAAAMYYTGPSEDFSRPGRTWYPTLGKTRFPLWGEVSICYHEGVPGHHLQIAQVRYLADTLSRYQRTLAGTSGHAEGWALYAERLMGELGYLDDPAYELGMLRAQAMRAVRVVVDIGMHLELAIPADERYHPGETWTPELALPFVIERSKFPADFMAQRGRPLPRAARPGDQLQGRRAGVARRARRRRDGARRRRVRPQGVPPRRARPRARWASTSSTPSWRGSNADRLVAPAAWSSRGEELERGLGLRLLLTTDVDASLGEERRSFRPRPGMPRQAALRRAARGCRDAVGVRPHLAHELAADSFGGDVQLEHEDRAEDRRASSSVDAVGQRAR